VKLERLRRLLPGLWAGLLLCVAGLATPAPFATLVRADAGKVVGHIFAREAALSLVLAVALLLLERQRASVWHAEQERYTPHLSSEMLLVLGTVFCTVAGYYAVQPMMALAKAGQATALSFGQLHALSFGLFGLKMVLVGALAWRASAAAQA
jgi:hypothetical protein